jgi:hypothetical protein
MHGVLLLLLHVSQLLPRMMLLQTVLLLPLPRLLLVLPGLLHWLLLPQSHI